MKRQNSFLTCFLIGGIFAFIQSFSLPSFGVVVSAGSTGSATVTSSSASGAYTPHVVTNTTPTSTAGVQNNGSDASKKQGQGNAAALAALAAMLATMAATCPSCEIKGTCGVCAAATIGAAASGLTAGKMKEAQNKSNQQVKDVNPVTGVNNTTGVVGARSDEATADEINKKAKGSGVSVSKDLKKVKLADGRQIAVANAVGNANGSGGGSSGLKGSELSSLKDALKKAQDAALKAAKDGEQSGDSSLVVGGKSGSSTDANGAQASAARVSADRQPASTAGMFKDHDGDRIGVASDSMFDMIARRYKLHGNNNSFMQ